MLYTYDPKKVLKNVSTYINDLEIAYSTYFFRKVMAHTRIGENN